MSNSAHLPGMTNHSDVCSSESFNDDIVVFAKQVSNQANHIKAKHTPQDWRPSCCVLTFMTFKFQFSSLNWIGIEVENRMPAYNSNINLRK